MIVTKILRRKKRPQRYAVYLDEAFAFEVSDEVLLKFGLRTGLRLEERTIADIASAEAMSRAQKLALHYLSYRPRSSREIIDRLVRKGFSKNLAQEVAEHFRELKLVNDLEFARMFVRDKLRGRPMGKALLRRRLLEKGITPHTIERVLREHVSDEDEQNAATTLAAKKLKLSAGTFAKLNPTRQKKRLLDYLLQRGFSSEVAAKTVRSVLA